MRQKEIRRNKEWDNLPEEKKRVILDSLPIPLPIIIAIFIAIIYGFPLLAGLIFKEISLFYLKLMQIVIFLIFSIWLVYELFFNYNKKTGKLLNKELEK